MTARERRAKFLAIARGRATYFARLEVLERRMLTACIRGGIDFASVRETTRRNRKAAR